MEKKAFSLTSAQVDYLKSVSNDFQISISEYLRRLVDNDRLMSAQNKVPVNNALYCLSNSVGGTCHANIGFSNGSISENRNASHGSSKSENSG